MYSTLKCLEKFDKLRFQFSTTTILLVGFVQEEKLSNFVVERNQKWFGNGQFMVNYVCILYAAMAIYYLTQVLTQSLLILH